MQKKQYCASRNIIFFISVFAVFVFIYILNILYPLHAEDWDYSFLWIATGDSPHRVSGINDIILSQYNHYMNWGGRSIVHAIDQLLLLIGTFWHDMLNSLVFTLFVLLIYKISNWKNPVSYSVFIVLFLLLWFLQPAFTATVLWITGSANYLWGAFIVLLFIYPYYRYYKDEKGKDAVWKMIAFFMAGIIAGWTNENLALALIFFIVVLLLVKRRQGKIPKWAICGLVGVVLGCAIMLLAPGNYIRIENSRAVDLDLVSRFILMAKMYKRYMLILFFIYSGLSILFLKSNKAEKYRIYFGSFLFFISAHIGFFAMFFSPEFPPRAAFGIISFTIVAIGILYANLDFEYKKVRIVNLSAIIIVCIVFFVQYYQRYTYLKYASDLWHERELFVSDQKSKGINDIIFTDKFEIGEHFEMYEFPDDTNEWFNRVYARYYGVNSARALQSTDK